MANHNAARVVRQHDRIACGEAGSQRKRCRRYGGVASADRVKDIADFRRGAMAGVAVISQSGALAASRNNGNFRDLQLLAKLLHCPAEIVIRSKLAIEEALCVLSIALDDIYAAECLEFSLRIGRKQYAIALTELPELRDK